MATNGLLSMAAVLIGLFSAAFLLWAYLKLSKGQMSKLVKWMLITVLLAGFPLALYNYFLSSGLITVQDPGVREMPISVFLFIFFAGMLYITVIALDISRQFGFKEKAEAIRQTIERAKKKR